MASRPRILPLSLALSLFAAPALAEPLRLELNALLPQDNACQFVFVAQNESPVDLGQMVLEAVLFDTEGRVSALTLLDLQDLPAGHMRVRSFQLAGLDCATVGRLLINGVSSCEPAGAEACAAPLTVSSRTGVEVLQ